MVAQIMLTLSAVILTVVAGSAPAQCDDDVQSCAMFGSPRAGDAMIQTASASAQAPLQGRVATLQAEVTSVEERVAALQESVGAGGGGAAAVQVDQKDPYAKYAKLLQSGYDSKALSDDVAQLETQVSEVESSILALETQVSGNAFNMKFESSLLSGGAQKVASTGSQEPSTSLSSRVVALEEEVKNCRTRVSSLEQTVVGLQVSAK
jgi:uncharacterized protein YceH (UPF0502 family)